MDEELNTMLEKALAAKLGDGYIRAMFPTTVIYVNYSTSGEIAYEDGKMYEIPWRYDEELGLLVGEETEVELSYVEKRIADEFGPELSAPIVMKNAEKRIVYGPVLVPGEKDYDGESVTSEKIEEVAHKFLKSYGNVDVQHTLNNVARPVESYLMPVDVELPGLNGPVAVPKGTWMMGTYVEDDKTWQEIKDGKRTGFSIMGVRKSVLKDAAGKSIEGAFKRMLLRDLGDEWEATHVSIVDRPCVPKAEFLVVKSKGFVARLFTRKQTIQEDDMNKDEVEQVVKELLEKSEPDEAIKALDEKIAALEAKVEEATKSEPEPEEPAVKNDTEGEITIEALKAKIDELTSGVEEQKAFRAEVEKRLAVKPASKGLPSEDTPSATKSHGDFGNRDAAGRKIRA